MNDNPYWLVSGLSYEEAMKLAFADCITNFQYDHATGETKFWPGSKEVHNHLSSTIKPRRDIVSANGRAVLGWATTKILG